MEKSRLFYVEKEFKDTEIGKMPRDWNIVKLEDVAKFKRGFSYRSEDLNKKPTSIRFITINDIEKEGGIKLNVEPVYLNEHIKIDSNFFLESGDLLIANTDMSKGFIIGAPILIEKIETNAVYSMDLTKLIFNNSELESKYLFYYFKYEQTRQKMKSFAQGTNVLHLNHELIKSLLTPLPPLSEQRQIASILSAIDKAIQKTDEVIAKTERLKKGMMQELLTKGIGYKEYKQTPIGTISKTWQIVKLGEVLELCQYGLSVKFSEKGKYRILKMDDIVDGVAISDNAKFVDLDEKTFNNFKLEKGDILFNRTNSYELVGRTGIFLLDGDYTFASYLIRLRPKKELIDSQFLTYYMVFSQNRLRQLATRAVHQANINATNLQSFIIPIPPLSEQKQIASILSAIDRKLELERNEKSRLERIKKGFMNKLLTGKIRVRVEN